VISDLLQSAKKKPHSQMDFLKKFASEATGESKPAAGEKKPAGDSSKPSQTDLLAKAQVVADAAKATYQKDPNIKVDNAKTAGAAADLLDAAEKYGKLDTSTGIGSYVEKAENYLHEYESSNSAAKPPAELAEKKTDVPAPAPAPEATKESEAPAPVVAKEEAKPEGGFGGIMKNAGDFLK
jgi:hypothetical protein